MPKQTLLEKLIAEPTGSFHVLDPEKAKRLNAKTLYIPSVQEVAEAIRHIPKGQTRTIVQLRNELAVLGGAEIACPAVTIKYWKWMAAGSEEFMGTGSLFEIPWWRVKSLSEK